ncbi:MAG: dihydroorotase, partial [Rhodospirillales bacterium]|nr:dihydroorotase [Rhodospirillales bacterium]
MADTSHNGPTPDKIAYVNAHLLDPASGLDGSGAIMTEGEGIADMGPDLFRDGKGWSVPDGVKMVDCGGAYLAPGFVDIRVQTGEPGQEHKGTLASAGRAATAGGITSMVCLP